MVAGNITINGANISWAPVNGATSYSVQYKLSSASTWTTVASTPNSYSLSNLTDCTGYQVQVAAVCSGTTGTYSAPVTFSTACVTYCTAMGTNPNLNYLSNITLGTLNNTSGATSYTNYTTNSALQPTLLVNNSYTLSASITIAGNAAAGYSGMAAWIDFNKNGVFEASERVLNMPVASPALPIGTTPFSGSFTVPSTASLNTPLRMRIVLAYAAAANAGLSLPDSYACTTYPNGEVEDYNVIVTNPLSTSEVSGNNGISIYPNPATDFLNVTKVSDKATYKIYNAAGQLVSNGNINGGRINVSALVKGVYVIAIEDKGDDLFKSKFIKK